MMDQDHDKTEDFLKGFSLKPAPAGLREKILSRTARRRTETRVMTPFLWKALAAGLILTAVVWGADAVVSKSQQNQLESFLKRPSVSPLGRDEDRDSLDEVFNGVLRLRFAGGERAASNVLKNRSEILAMIRDLNL